ncbi:hypothetical protein C8J56DRAFT_804380 [Mycena floridula]|nr:hypothetical protein C8J56DRAFT_804380 [Mycena floridula]
MRVGLSSRFHFAFALSLLFVCSLVHAANVIIDDTFGDPTNGVKIVYAPDIWNFGPKCTSCTAKPDPSQAYLETWDDTSQFGNFASVNATVSFTGVSRFLLCYILELKNKQELLDLTFFIDGQNKSTYFYLSDGPDAGEDYLYHVQFFSIDSLSPGPHTLVIQVGDKEAGRNSVILLDYITYSPLDEPTSTSSSSSPTSTCSR